jgi:hypothetical protein
MSEHPDIGLMVAMKDEADILASALGFAPRLVQRDTSLEYWSDDESLVLRPCKSSAMRGDALWS